VRPRSYVKTLDAALAPLGFERRVDDWVRVRGDLWECVNRQAGMFGVTANLYAKDLETERVFQEIFRGDDMAEMLPQYERIGSLIDGRDRWWTSDERDGPTEMAEAVVSYGLPWFERGLTLQGQHEAWYGGSTAPARGWYDRNSMIGLALTLHRMGKVQEACAVLGRPVPRMAIPKSVAMVAKVREWMGCGGERP
jgi:hypothetical protein